MYDHFTLTATLIANELMATKENLTQTEKT